MPSHFERMLQLADEFFHVKNDPEQLDVDESVIEELYVLHPATVSEEADGDGPVCWILLIPSSMETMELFLKGDISEREILNRSAEDRKFETVYLCSALVLPEFRKKGIAERLTLTAINEMRKDFKIHFLYTWPFSAEGKLLSKKLAMKTGIPLRIRE